MPHGMTDARLSVGHLCDCRTFATR